MSALSPELALKLGSRFQCPVCNAGFTTLSTKKNHIRTEHIGTKKAKR